MKKMSKSTAAVFLFTALFSSAACSKTNNSNNSNQAAAGKGLVSDFNERINSSGTEKSTPAVSASVPTPTKNQELAKIDEVYSKMSNRFKAEIKINDKDEFLKELHKVLESEKQYTSEDLPLYFLIDKKHPVGADYEPKNLTPLVKNDDYVINKDTLSLRPDAAEALAVLGRAAKKDGITLDVSSSYRSYAYQDRLFNYWVSVDGLEEAERESARPGTSQHQLGVAVDFGSIDDNYDKTPGGRWMYAHGAEYGWSLSFPKEYEDVTGYRWECWHFRFIGVEACRFQKKWFNDVQQYMLEFIDCWKNS